MKKREIKSKNGSFYFSIGGTLYAFYLQIRKLSITWDSDREYRADKRAWKGEQ